MTTLIHVRRAFRRLRTGAEARRDNLKEQYWAALLTGPPPDHLVVSLRDELGRQTGADIPVFDEMVAIAISDPRFCRGDGANVRSLRVARGTRAAALLTLRRRLIGRLGDAARPR